jgi:hypothetical protein
LSGFGTSFAELDLKKVVEKKHDPTRKAVSEEEVIP